jgi:hypothetical protein
LLFLLSLKQSLFGNSVCAQRGKRNIKKPVLKPVFGANDGARTRYLHLGKVALYQMSYVRILTF